MTTQTALLIWMSGTLAGSMPAVATYFGKQAERMSEEASPDTD